MLPCEGTPWPWFIYLNIDFYYVLRCPGISNIKARRRNTAGRPISFWTEKWRFRWNTLRDPKQYLDSPVWATKFSLLAMSLSKTKYSCITWAYGNGQLSGLTFYKQKWEWENIKCSQTRQKSSVIYAYKKCMLLDFTFITRIIKAPIVLVSL